MERVFQITITKYSPVARVGSNTEIISVDAGLFKLMREVSVIQRKQDGKENLKYKFP